MIGPPPIIVQGCSSLQIGDVTLVRSLQPPPMGKKRKRPVKGDRAPDKSSQADLATASTCFKNNSSLSRAHAEEHAHPVISLYYPQVVTLRQYLLRQIPLSSRARRRRIASIRDDQPPVRISNDGRSGAQLAKLLDTTLVGILTESPPTCNEERRQELAAFTQSQSRSELTSTDTGPPCAQAEVCYAPSRVCT